jgi:hypothetical protein
LRRFCGPGLNGRPATSARPGGTLRARKWKLSPSNVSRAPIAPRRGYALSPGLRRTPV